QPPVGLRQRFGALGVPLAESQDRQSECRGGQYLHGKSWLTRSIRSIREQTTQTMNAPPRQLVQSGPERPARPLSRSRKLPGQTLDRGLLLGEGRGEPPERF